MVLHRHALAAVLIAALQPVGDVHSEPSERGTASGRDKAMDAVALPAEDYYRLGTSAYRFAGQRAVFGMAAMVRPAVTPGTTDWLTRGPTAEPLASTYASPHAARKEVGLSYSSDGRVNAYVAERDRVTPPGAAHDGPGCCATEAGSAASQAYYAKGAETPAVASLLGQLKTKGLKLTLEDGWKLTGGARSREYSNSTLNSRIAHITLQRWWGDWSTAYSLQVEKRGGWNLAPSQSFQLGYALTPRSTVGMAYTSGQELAFFGAQGMLKTEVRSLTLQGEHTVEKNWSLRFDAGYYHHGDLPAHRAIRFAFRRSL